MIRTLNGIKFGSLHNIVQLLKSLGTMKTVVVLAALVALSLGEIIVHHRHEVNTKPVDGTFVDKQMKVLSLLENVDQINHHAEYYKIGMDWNVEANAELYTNQQAVKEFLNLWRVGFVPKMKVFSIFYDRMREEAIALFRLFYYAENFEVFYKTAAFARVHMNSGQFLYAYYIAVLQRRDTWGIVLPAPYELYPEMFFDQNVLSRLSYIKESGHIPFPEKALSYGLVQEDNNYVVYANYSNNYVFNNDEQRLTYFTEDIGLNSYYFYFHAQLPFWWNGDKFGPFKERRGEIYYFFYKQLLNRYYFERLTNGLGPIPEFSWFYPITTGYYPLMSAKAVPYAQRPDYYNVNFEHNYEDILYLDSFEKSFLQYLETSHFNAYDQEIDFHDPKALNFVGNFWQYNADLFHENFTHSFQKSYEATARHILGAAPHPVDRYSFLPSALDFYQTSLRDPAFYQLYNRIFQYIVQFKKYLNPYSREELNFNGVKISKVDVEKMTTYFDMYDFNVTNSVYFNQAELNHYPHSFVVRQPRLNNKPFSVSIELKSEVKTQAVFKIFLGPKYDSNGYPIRIEDNWTKFYMLDWFSHDLEVGKNEVKRNSNDFLFFKEDSLPMSDIMHMLNEGKVSKDMSEEFDNLPRRLMLPRGTKDGFPFQLFVFVYKYEAIPKELEPFKQYVIDNKPFSYPFDRPVRNSYFIQPNMYFEDVSIYHEGEIFPYMFNYPTQAGVPHSNEVPK